MARNPDHLWDLAGEARRQLDSFCDDMLGDSAGATECAWRPPMDVFECEHCIVVKLEIAGLQPGEAEVVVQRNLLIIRGERRDHSPHVRRAVHQVEIRFGKFERRIRVDIPFDREAVSYRYADGFLEVTVPKAVPPKPRKVRLQF